VYRKWAQWAEGDIDKALSVFVFLGESSASVDGNQDVSSLLRAIVLVLVPALKVVRLALRVRGRLLWPTLARRASIIRFYYTLFRNYSPLVHFTRHSVSSLNNKLCMAQGVRSCI
jgi:hypothetical protein